MSTPDTQDKKSHNSRLSPCSPATATGGELLQDRRCATAVRRAAAESAATTATAGRSDGMDCAACARKVETAVRQVPGSVRSRCCSPPKSCWLTPRAMSALRLRTRSARRGIRCAMRCSRSRANPRVAAAATICRLLTLVIMMALSWGLEQANHPVRSVGVYRHHAGWPVAGCPPGATPDRRAGAGSPLKR